TGPDTIITVDPKIKPALALYALPNAGLVGTGNTGIYSFVGQQVAGDNFVSTRLDHHFSDKDSVFVTYAHDSSLLTLPDSLNTVLIQQDTSNQHYAVEESHIFSGRLVNEVRFGYNREHDTAGAGQSAINPAAADVSLGWIPTLDVGQLTVTGLAVLSGGVNSQITQIPTWNS